MEQTSPNKRKHSKRRESQSSDNMSDDTLINNPLNKCDNEEVEPSGACDRNGAYKLANACGKNVENKFISKPAQNGEQKITITCDQNGKYTFINRSDKNIDQKLTHKCDHNEDDNLVLEYKKCEGKEGKEVSDSEGTPGPQGVPLSPSQVYIRDKEFPSSSDVTSDDFNTILNNIGGFGKQQKILFATQCVLCIFYSFLIFGQIFMTLTPDHWCQAPEDVQLALRNKMMRERRDHNIRENLNYLGMREAAIVYDQKEDVRNTNTTATRDGSADRGQRSVRINEEPINMPIDETEFQKRLKSMTIPMNAEGTAYQQCAMYTVNWTKLADPKLPLQLNRTMPTQDCTDGWAYNYTLYYPTITSELSWVCDASGRQPFAQAMFFFGSLVGGPLFGWLADAHGRKPALIASNVLAGIAGTASALAPNFVVFCVSRFVVGFNAYSQINIVYILTMEFVTPQYRNFVNTVPFMLFLTAGFTMLPWLGYFTANWRVLGILMHAPTILTPILWWLIPESVRWLVGKGRHRQAVQTLEKVAATNGIQVTEKLRDSLLRFVTTQKASNYKNVPVHHLLRTPRLRKHFLALCMLLVCVRFLYDAHVRIFQLIKYNLFVTFSIASALEVFAGLLAYLLADRLGRRPTTVAMFLISAAVEAAMALVDEDNTVMQLALHLIGKMSIACAINVCFLFPVEVLPTVARSQGVGVVHTMGFVVSFVSPYVVYYSRQCRECALFLLSAVAVVGGLTCFFLLPETNNQNLPDTLDEGEEFCRGQPLCGICNKDAPSTTVDNTQQENKEIKVLV